MSFFSALQSRFSQVWGHVQDTDRCYTSNIISMKYDEKKIQIINIY